MLDSNSTSPFLALLPKLIGLRALSIANPASRNIVLALGQIECQLEHLSISDGAYLDDEESLAIRNNQPPAPSQEVMLSSLRTIRLERVTNFTAYRLLIMMDYPNVKVVKSQLFRLHNSLFLHLLVASNGHQPST